jgi:protein-S-isoprenylcysteine O-methyltransferase Ste14
MSRWGVGPSFAAISIFYGLIMISISLYFYPLFKINFIDDSILNIAGIVLILIGVPFFILSVVAVTKAYNSDRLTIKGVFGCCRHPLYASWVVFIVPGIVLIFNSWIGLSVPLFMYFLLKILVKKEEKYLEKRFGKEYSDYIKKVPCIIPYGIFGKN